MKDYQLHEDDLIVSFRPEYKPPNPNQPYTHTHNFNQTHQQHPYHHHNHQLNHVQEPHLHRGGPRLMQNENNYHLGVQRQQETYVKRGQSPPIMISFSSNQPPIMQTKAQVVTNIVHQPQAYQIVRNQETNVQQQQVHVYNTNQNQSQPPTINQHYITNHQQIPITAPNYPTIQRQLIQEVRNNNQPIANPNQNKEVVVHHYRQSNVIPVQYYANQQHVVQNFQAVQGNQNRQIGEQQIVSKVQQTEGAQYQLMPPMQQGNQIPIQHAYHVQHTTQVPVHVNTNITNTANIHSNIQQGQNATKQPVPNMPQPMPQPIPHPNVHHQPNTAIIHQGHIPQDISPTPQMGYMQYPQGHPNYQVPPHYYGYYPYGPYPPQYARHPNHYQIPHQNNQMPMHGYPVYQMPPEYQQYYNQGPPHQQPTQQNYSYPPEYAQNQYEQYPPQYNEQGQHPQQQVGPNPIWQERFEYLHEKYLFFYQKYEGITKETGFLAEQFLTVDNQEEWLALKDKFDILVEKMIQSKDENQIILQEIHDNLEQSQKIQNENEIKEQNGRVWEHRYHELLQQYESLSHHYAELQSSSLAQNDMDENDRLGMMNEKYAQLEAEYNNVVQQLQNAPSQAEARQQHQDFLKYTQQLQGYIQQLQIQNNTLMKGMKTSVEDSKFLDPIEINQKLIQKESQIKNLTHMIVQLEERVKESSEMPGKRIDIRSSQLEHQLNQINTYCTELQQSLSMKDYEINGLKDKVLYLQEQLSVKTQELQKNSKFFKDKLQKIQFEVSNKNISSHVADTHSQKNINFNIGEDYENRMKEYQKLIQSKNNQIRTLEDRIYESESEARKLHFQKTTHSHEWREKLENIQSEFRQKSGEKDLRIRKLEKDLQDFNEEFKKKSQEKQNIIKKIEEENTKYRDDYENKIIQKNFMIKNLKDNLSRMQVQIKQRNSQISRIRSPNLTPMLRSPNQSFNANDNIRFQEQLRQITDQMQRRNDENNKLKKEREARNKQFKDLEVEYDRLQEQNNKRRVEINTLKRQVSTLENNEYEIQNLRNLINKRNSQVNELKNHMFQVDKIKMNLQSKIREVQKLSQISRIKAKELEQLTAKNYSLEEKIRSIQFKVTNTDKYQVQYSKNYHEEINNLQEELRKKQIDLNKYKILNEQLEHHIKRQKEELSKVQSRYPPKIKALSEELHEFKAKYSAIQKKYVFLEGQVKELEEMNKKMRNSNFQENNTEVNRIKEYYSKYVDRQEEDIKVFKEKIRTYEVQCHDYQQENSLLNARIKENEISKNQGLKKISLLSDKLESKEEEIRNIKNKDNAETTALRKKESRIGQLQMQIKQKDTQITQLQLKFQQLKQSSKVIKKQYDNYKHNTIQKMQVSTHKEMENLNKQISDYESKLILQNHNFDFKLKDKKANQVFQRRVIYELKQENDFLRKQLQGKGINISIQKLRITQMQQQALMKSKSLNQKDSNAYIQQLNFYRQKNKELQQRVNNHISVNKNLRERLEHLLEEANKYEEIDKLKMRINQLQIRQLEYIEKINRLIDENKNIKKENNTLNISNDFNQEYQIRVQELNKKINQVMLEKNLMQQENSILKVDINNLKGRYEELERQVSKLLGEIKGLKEENDRLKNSQLSNSNQSSMELFQLRKNNQQLNYLLTEKEQDISTLSLQYNSLQKYLHELEQEIKIVKERLSESQGAVFQIEHLRKTIVQLQRDHTELNEHIVHLIEECNFYKSQVGDFKGKDQTRYYVELIRSNFVQVETLLGQVPIQNEKTELIFERIGENVNIGLETCKSLNELFF